MCIDCLACPVSLPPSALRYLFACAVTRIVSAYTEQAQDRLGGRTDWLNKHKMPPKKKKPKKKKDKKNEDGFLTKLKRRCGCISDRPLEEAYGTKDDELPTKKPEEEKLIPEAAPKEEEKQKVHDEKIVPKAAPKEETKKDTKNAQDDKLKEKEKETVEPVAAELPEEYNVKGPLTLPPIIDEPGVGKGYCLSMESASLIVLFDLALIRI